MSGVLTDVWADVFFFPIFLSCPIDFRFILGLRVWGSGLGSNKV